MVEIVVIVSCHLSGGMAGIVYAVGFEGAQRHGVDGVANLLAAGGGRVDLEKVSDARILCHLAEDELSGDAAADVAVADE